MFSTFSQFLKRLRPRYCLPLCVLIHFAVAIRYFHSHLSGPTGVFKKTIALSLTAMAALPHMLPSHEHVLRD